MGRILTTRGHGGIKFQCDDCKITLNGTGFKVFLAQEDQCFNFLQISISLHFRSTDECDWYIFKD